MNKIKAQEILDQLDQKVSDNPNPGDGAVIKEILTRVGWDLEEFKETIKLLGTEASEFLNRGVPLDIIIQVGLEKAVIVGLEVTQLSDTEHHTPAEVVATDGQEDDKTPASNDPGKHG